MGNRVPGQHHTPVHTTAIELLLSDSVNDIGHKRRCDDNIQSTGGLSHTESPSKMLPEMNIGNTFAMQLRNAIGQHTLRIGFKPQAGFADE